MDQPTLHALLIGINYYIPNQFPLGNYKTLHGCVADVLRAEAFLRERLRVPAANIRKLTSTIPLAGSEPPEPPEQRPTYANIVAELLALGDTARADDQVYIHYSGHGGRAATWWKHLKGESGLDETIVPMDIGTPDGRYLRDIELAHLLGRLVQRGMLVTVVLDSCHSGGMPRSMGDEFRGGSFIDLSPRPVEQSLAGSDDELIVSYRKGSKRSAELSSGWLPEPEGYVLLAACRPSEKACESIFEGTSPNGALSYFLFDALKDLPPGTTYRQLHGQLLGRVHSRYGGQTPVIEGEGDRVIFGYRFVKSPHGVLA